MRRRLVQKELTEKTGVKYLIRGLQEKNLDVTWQELYTWYQKDPKWKEKSRRTFNGMVLQTSGGSIVGKRCKSDFTVKISKEVLPEWNGMQVVHVHISLHMDYV